MSEDLRDKPYLKTLVPKFRFLIEVLKLVFTDIKSHRPFRSKKSKTYSKELTKVQ